MFTEVLFQIPVVPEGRLLPKGSGVVDSELNSVEFGLVFAGEADLSGVPEVVSDLDSEPKAKQASTSGATSYDSPKSTTAPSISPLEKPAIESPVASIAQGLERPEQPMRSVSTLVQPSTAPKQPSMATTKPQPKSEVLASDLPNSTGPKVGQLTQTRLPEQADVLNDADRKNPFENSVVPLQKGSNRNADGFQLSNQVQPGANPIPDPSSMDEGLSPLAKQVEIEGAKVPFADRVFSTNDQIKLGRPSVAPTEPLPLREQKQAPDLEKPRFLEPSKQVENSESIVVADDLRREARQEGVIVKVLPTPEAQKSEKNNNREIRFVGRTSAPDVFVGDGATAKNDEDRTLFLKTSDGQSRQSLPPTSLPLYESTSVNGRQSNVRAVVNSTDKVEVNFSRSEVSSAALSSTSASEARPEEKTQPTFEGKGAAAASASTPLSDFSITRPEPSASTQIDPASFASDGELRRQGLSGTVAVEATVAKSDTARPVVAQLSEAVRTASNGTVEIKLSPEELGRVKLTLSSTEAGLTVSILAERPETMDLIRRHVEILAQDLRQQGHQNLNFQFGQGDNPGQQPGFVNPPEREPLPVEEPAKTSKPEYINRALTFGRLDLRI